MSDIHIIGTLSREDTIEEAALYFAKNIDYRKGFNSL